MRNAAEVNEIGDEGGAGTVNVMIPMANTPGQLGAILDAKVSPPKILGFAPDSGARAGGLKEGDAITAIGETTINTYADIRIAMLDMTVDQVIQVEVSRKRLFGGMKPLQFEVRLN